MSSETSSNNLFGWEEKQLLRHRDGIKGDSQVNRVNERRNEITLKRETASSSDVKRYCQVLLVRAKP